MLEGMFLLDDLKHWDVKMFQFIGKIYEYHVAILFDYFFR